MAGLVASSSSRLAERDDRDGERVPALPGRRRSRCRARLEARGRQAARRAIGEQELERRARLVAQAGSRGAHRGRGRAGEGSRRAHCRRGRRIDRRSRCAGDTGVTARNGRASRRRARRAVECEPVRLRGVWGGRVGAVTCVCSAPRSRPRSWSARPDRARPLGPTARESLEADARQRRSAAGRRADDRSLAARRAGGHPDGLHRTRPTLTGLVAPDRGPVRARRPRLRRREARHDQGLRQPDGHDPDDVRRPPAARSTTTGTAACSAWRCRPTSRPTRTSTSCTRTTRRSAARRPRGTTPAPRRPGRPPTAASSAGGCRGSRRAATSAPGPSRC